MRVSTINVHLNTEQREGFVPNHGDFWLTRNGHGAGFWDRGLGDLGTRLAMSARAYGSQTLMLGHDGKIYN